MLDLSKSGTTPVAPAAPVEPSAPESAPEFRTTAKRSKKTRSENPRPRWPWYMNILHALLNNLMGKMFVWCVLVLLFGAVAAPMEFEHLMAAVGTGCFWIWILD